jgi:cob(I)alamin adenosyltransferase
MKVYTRTGDKGTTSLFSGDRVSKTNASIEALGAIDECNSSLGVAITKLGSSPELKVFHKQFSRIQHALFDLGAAVATPNTSASDFKKSKTSFDGESVSLLEEWMDSFEELLPELKTFILPGGHPAAAMLHLCRSTCRRAERRVTLLFQEENVSTEVIAYLNRLSDYFFVASRAVNALTKYPETLWKQ